jgi:hypothetical protein
VNKWRSEITTRAGHKLILEELFDAMDAELLSAALYATLHARKADWTDQRQAQHVWDLHRDRYLEKHGVPFPPDVNPEWSSMIPDSVIFTACGATYLLPRVWWFVNPALRAETVEAVLQAGSSQSDAHTLAQRVWDDYCARHLARFGEPFAADRDPEWSEGKPRVYELLIPSRSSRQPDTPSHSDPSISTSTPFSSTRRGRQPAARGDERRSPMHGPCHATHRKPGIAIASCIARNTESPTRPMHIGLEWELANPRRIRAPTRRICRGLVSSLRRGGRGRRTGVKREIELLPIEKYPTPNRREK